MHELIYLWSSGSSESTFFPFRSGKSGSESLVDLRPGFSLG